MTTASNLILAAYRAGALTEANNSLDSFSPPSAFTILGIDPKLSTKIAQPSFALAEALPKAGEKAVDLTKCHKFDGWDAAKPKIGVLPARDLIGPAQ